MARIIFYIFFSIIISYKTYSIDLTIDSFGKEKVQIFKIDKNNFFRIISTNNVFKTNTNIYGNSECAGTTEIYNKEILLNIICELRDGNDIAHFLIKNDNNTKGTDTEISTKVVFVGGTGPWKQLVKKKCFFAYIEFDEGASHTKIKCPLDEKTFNSFQR